MRCLEGKNALVTGGARGIGAAIVRRLAGEGAYVGFAHGGEVADEAAAPVEALGVLLVVLVLALVRVRSLLTGAVVLGVLAGAGALQLAGCAAPPLPRGRLGKVTVIGAGFAGATADAFTLFEKFEGKLEEFRGNLTRAAVELAKDWRTDRYLRRLEAMMIVADKQVTLILTGNGDVLEPVDGIAAIGSGGNFALAAARALKDYEADAETLARKAMAVAAEICVYTNDQLTVESMDSVS